MELGASNLFDITVLKEQESCPAGNLIQFFTCVHDALLKYDLIELNILQKNLQ
jgi:hypothetical protein